MPDQKSLTAVQQREKIIAGACTALVKDLQEIDPLTFFMFFNKAITKEAFDRICNTIDKHFPSKTMSFSCTGECITSWAEPPIVGLDMEFGTEDISAFFRLYIAKKERALELHHISFSEADAEPSENTERLANSLANASVKSGFS